MVFPSLYGYLMCRMSFCVILLNEKVGWMSVENNNVLMMVETVGYFM
jgi:hypothetical protein